MMLSAAALSFTTAYVIVESISPGISSHTMMLQPFWITSGMNLCPSLVVPRTATKSAPCLAFRESKQISLTFTSVVPCTSVSPDLYKRSFSNFIPVQSQFFVPFESWFPDLGIVFSRHLFRSPEPATLNFQEGKWHRVHPCRERSVQRRFGFYVL